MTWQAGRTPQRGVPTAMLQNFDERNRELLININGELMHRDRAGISPFDSAVQGGDAVWEGLRLYRRADLQVARTSRQATQLGQRTFVRTNSVRRRNHRADQAHAGREQDARWRAHPAHAHARREGHLRNGSAAQSKRSDADRARRTQIAGLREDGIVARSRARFVDRRQKFSIREFITPTY